MSLDANTLGAAVGSWILSYLLHATVLLSGAALAAILVRARPELEEAIWKLALVGGLVTAALQPAVAGWTTAPPVVEEPAVVVGVPLSLERGATALGAAAPESSWIARTLAPTAGWRWWLAAGWAAAAALLLARLLTASLTLRRRLAGRRAISGPLARLVDRLLEAAGHSRLVRLSRTDAIPVPIALGGEICLPERVLSELPPSEQETVVAHEMAHVLRRDPAWLLAGRILTAVFFFHPLVLLAGRRLRRVAELRCDDWAATATGRPLALARCLTRVAGWGGGAVPATAMAGDPRWLAGRVTRLLDRSHQEPPAPAARWLRPAAAAALVAMTLWMPGISLAGDAPAAPAAAAEAPLPPQPAPLIVPEPAAAPAPVVVPHPAAAPVGPARPAFAVPAPGPDPVAERRVLAEEARRMVERARELSRVEREEIRRERRRLQGAERETLRRLAEEMAAQRASLAEEIGRESRRIARELADQRQAMVDELRRVAEEAPGKTVELEDRQQHRRELARRLAEEAERIRSQAHLEMDRLVPEMERLRDELRLSNEERERLRHELETLRRELETLRRPRE